MSAGAARAPADGEHPNLLRMRESLRRPSPWDVRLVKKTTKKDGTPANPREGGVAGFEVNGRRVGGIHALIHKAFPRAPECCVDQFVPGHGYEKGVMEAYQRKMDCIHLKPKYHGKLTEDDFSLLVRGIPKGEDGRTPYHVCSLELHNFFERMGWRPVVLQYRMYSPELDVATPSDIIAYDTIAHQTILIELKTTTSVTDTRYRSHTNWVAIDPGGRVSYVEEGQTMPATGAVLPNNQLTMDLIQLLTMDRILVRDYGVRIDRKCVLRLHLSHIQAYVPPKKLERVFDSYVMPALCLARHAPTTRSVEHPKRPTEARDKEKGR